ncbi:tripartite tricarboxylate transporter TctB family protein [Microvirga terrae]|uniref:Tripartite tricarboxylate transporter TctB family protein n=1 Tax=Microvirga terrae TaxID=2740529 RepID=A0ABY5RSU1_9HYPH|nr:MULTISPECIES: tripartite tricarboxylate transporter TctB family protein [Microvirga]MBQ0821693.1 tripartite tricarboxylate transporter TctB family protein [Microvirga sp. HBU67558]UVF18862.1 tripartite tricarboxylate transporter TctB family protein [Microvirga terrae]
MSVLHEGSEPSRHRGPVRAPQSLAGGLLLVALAALALWLTRDLDQGTLNAMGPAMLPRWLAIGVGLSGLALLAAAFLKDGDLLERWSLRGPVFVIGAIVAFALTIRGYSFGSFGIPGLGLLVAGPLAIILGGFATPEARLRDLVILALSLTPFCMVLFGDLLNLPIPVFPQALTGLFPADWSQKAVLRACAAIMAIAAVVVFLTTRNRRRGPIDVADHSGRI